MLAGAECGGRAGKLRVGVGNEQAARGDDNGGYAVVQAAEMGQHLIVIKRQGGTEELPMLIHAAGGFGARKRGSARKEPHQ